MRNLPGASKEQEEPRSFLEGSEAWGCTRRSIALTAREGSVRRPADSQAGRGRAGEHLMGWGGVSWRKGVLEGGSDPLPPLFNTI